MPILTKPYQDSGHPHLGNLTVVSERSEFRLPAKVTRQPPVTIDTLLTKDEYVRLVAHMENDNPISHFLVAYTDDF